MRVAIAIACLLCALPMWASDKTDKAALRAELAKIQAQLATANKEKLDLANAVTAASRNAATAAVEAKEAVAANAATAQRLEAAQTRDTLAHAAAALRDAEAAKAAKRQRDSLAEAVVAQQKIVQTRLDEQAAAVREAQNANAGEAQAAVALAREAAEAADRKAVATAQAAKAQADQIQSEVQHSNLVLELSALAGVLSFFTLLVKTYADGRAHRWQLRRLTEELRASVPRCQ